MNLRDLSIFCFKIFYFMQDKFKCIFVAANETGFSLFLKQLQRQKY